MTSLVQNQGKRKFILKEGEIAPMGTLEMDDKEAQKICASYPDELQILKVLGETKVEAEKETESEDLMEKTKVELMEMLDEKGIEYKPIMNKAQLIALLKGV